MSDTAYRLSQHFQTEQNNLKAGVMMTLLLLSNVMEQITWENIGTLNITATRWKELPDVAFRDIGGSYSESYGRTEQLQETIYPLGGIVSLDKLYVKDQRQFVDPRQLQVDMKSKAVTYKFNDYFINNTAALDPKGFTGIKARIANLPARQSIAAATDGLDVLASTANMQTFLDKVNQAIYVIDEHKPSAIYGNQNSYLNFTSVARRLGLLRTTTDMFDREVETYRGIPIYDMGQKGDLTTDIILQTEAQGSSGSVCTSLYFVRYGASGGEYLHGIEEYPMDVEDLGRDPTTGLQWRTLLDWPLGLCHWNDRSMARLSGIKW